MSATESPAEAPEGLLEPPDDLARVWQGLVDIGRPEMLRVASVNSCIPAARLCQEVLTKFGMPSKCYQAFMVAANEKFMELMHAGRISWDESLPDWAVEEGAWALGMGAQPNDPKDDPGHVVCVTGRWMLDLALDQASRPEKNITLVPALIRLDYHGKNLGGSFVTPENTLAVWRLVPERGNAWKAGSVDWQNWESRYGFIAGKVIRKVREGL